jgi:hypothetical protein
MFDLQLYQIYIRWPICQREIAIYYIKNSYILANYGITVLGPEKGGAAQMEPQPKLEIVEVIEIIEIVEIEEFAKRGEHVPHAKHYAFRVDKERVVVTTPTITGTEILAKVRKTPEGSVAKSAESVLVG